MTTLTLEASAVQEAQDTKRAGRSQEVDKPSSSIRPLETHVAFLLRGFAAIRHVQATSVRTRLYCPRFFSACPREGCASQVSRKVGPTGVEPELNQATACP
ncbi:unnamed protein product [Symbiodinium natans]|uniref:Uncharacterized protein n=1 Tax=Symbiodinium natans TaxID=878477 RepID=A0A812NEX2_9DINO|nr:unnamed protein product [Symbiodinium natans]